MFHSADLALRRIASRLPAHAGYALTRRWTPRLGGARRRWIGDAVAANVQRYLGDQALAAQAAGRFVVDIACDDLDAITGFAWSEKARLAATRVEGGEHLPGTGPALVTSFHFSGGFRIFDVLRARGRSPLFLHAPPRSTATSYERALLATRHRYFERDLSPAYVAPGPGARDAIDRRLADGGVVVALLDVSPELLGLRDHAACRLLDRDLRLPIGLLRLAARSSAPVIPYDGRLDGDQRILRFQHPIRGSDPEELLGLVLRACETVIRERPWSWQAWLDADALFGAAPAGD